VKPEERRLKKSKKIDVSWSAIRGGKGRKGLLELKDKS
jgi:hypothetical protein